MKKLAISVIVGLVLSVVAAVAQTGTDSSQGTPSSPSMNQSGAASQQQPSQSQPGYGQPDAAAGQTGQATSTGTGSSEKGEKKLHGCVQSQGGQFVLESKKGKAIALTGQDVSAHVGHEVSVKGSWESGGAGAGVSTGGASSEKTFNVSSVEMISDSCGGKSSKGDSGSMAPPSSSTNPSGTGSTSNPPQQ
jgi:hypothetical protein